MILISIILIVIAGIVGFVSGSVFFRYDWENLPHKTQMWLEESGRFDFFWNHCGYKTAIFIALIGFALLCISSIGHEIQLMQYVFYFASLPILSLAFWMGIGRLFIRKFTEEG